MKSNNKNNKHLDQFIQEEWNNIISNNKWSSDLYFNFQEWIKSLDKK